MRGWNGMLTESQVSALKSIAYLPIGRVAGRVVGRRITEAELKFGAYEKLATPTIRTTAGPDWEACL